MAFVIVFLVAVLAAVLVVRYDVHCVNLYCVELSKTIDAMRREQLKADQDELDAVLDIERRLDQEEEADTCKSTEVALVPDKETGDGWRG